MTGALHERNLLQVIALLEPLEPNLTNQIGMEYLLAYSASSISILRKLLNYCSISNYAVNQYFECTQHKQCKSR